MVDAPPEPDNRVKSVGAYKTILRAVLDVRPSGTRLKLAAALGKNRSFVSQITNTGYPVPIPAEHIETIFEICHLSPAERHAFLEAYHLAHPGRLKGQDLEAQMRTISLTVPDLGEARKNRALDHLVADFAARAARFAKDLG